MDLYYYLEYYKNNNLLPAIKMAMIEDRILTHLLDSKLDKKQDKSEKKQTTTDDSKKSEDEKKTSKPAAKKTTKTKDDK